MRPVGYILASVGVLAACLLLLDWAASDTAASPGVAAARTAPLTGEAAEQAALEALYRRALAGGEHEVVVYQAATDPEWQPLWKAFAATFPGIRVTYMHLSPTGVTDRLDIEQATGGRYADVISQPVNVMSAIADRGYLEAWAPPNADRLPQRFRDPQGRFQYAYSKVFGLGYSLRRVKHGGYPTDLDALLASRWTHKFDYVSPGGGAGTTDVAIVALRERGKLPDAKLQALRDQGLSGGGPETSITALSQGRTALNAWAYLAPLRRQQRAGAPIAIAFPEDLSLIVPFGQGLARDAAHPFAARLLIAWLLTPYAQKVLAEQSYAVSNVEGSPSPEGFPADPEARRRLEPPDPSRASALIAKAQPELRALWQGGKIKKPGRKAS